MYDIFILKWFPEHFLHFSDNWSFLKEKPEIPGNGEIPGIDKNSTGKNKWIMILNHPTEHFCYPRS